MKSNCSLSLIVLSLLLLSLSAATALNGGWTPFKNINDALVKEIAEFAVTEHNRETGEKLKFESIIKGETQVVSGINYRIVLEANDGSASKKYAAVVNVKLWHHFKSLISFEPLLSVN